MFPYRFTLGLTKQTVWTDEQHQQEHCEGGDITVGGGQPASVGCRLEGIFQHPAEVLTPALVSMDTKQRIRT